MNENTNISEPLQPQLGMNRCYVQPFFSFFNADNMAVMKTFKDKEFDLAIVDPPYNASDAIETNKSNSKNKATKRTVYKQFENIAPTDEYWQELKRISKNQIVWGGNFFGLKGGVIAWNKNGTAFGEGEVAICTTHNSVRFFEYTWNGMLQGNMKNKEIRVHPTQKPIQLYEYIISNYAKDGFKILDTHLGSGSIAIAIDKANTLDKKNLTFVGIELDPDYFRAAVERFKNHKKQGVLF
jgi:site-specific DNA-methyltransferase (adenine-specific)